jgi:sugar/nucleoside kinase (ribokinase family)
MVPCCRMKQMAGRPAHSFDVITVGAAVVDEYAKSSAFELERSAAAPDGFNTCFPLGAKLDLSSLAYDTGGGATNAAVTFGRLGLKTATVCRVGEDLFGDVIAQKLEDEHVSRQFVQRDPKLRTGQSIILVSNIGYRTILVHRGASANISHREIPWTKIHTRWFYVTSLGGDLGLFSLILDRAEVIGARVMWNPGNAELEKGLGRLTPLIRRVDVLNVNREEASVLAEKPVRHLKSVVAKLGALPKIGLLVSDGPRGAYLHARDCTWHTPAIRGKRVNTTGAGDALGSGFLAGFLKTCDLSIAMKIGMLNAFGVVSHMGAKVGILRHWPIERDLERIKVTCVKLKD